MVTIAFKIPCGIRADIGFAENNQSANLPVGVRVGMAYESHKAVCGPWVC